MSRNNLAWKLKVGDPVTIDRDGALIRWTEGCGYDLLGNLPESAKLVNGYLVLPGWFGTMLFGGGCQ